MGPNANLDWDAIDLKLREHYAEDIVQEMLVKLFRAKHPIDDPIHYAHACLRTVHQETWRSRQRRSKELVTFDGLPKALSNENPLARAIARQEIERAPESLVADELGIRPLTRLQRHRARRRADR